MKTAEQMSLWNGLQSNKAPSTGGPLPPATSGTGNVTATQLQQQALSGQNAQYFSYPYGTTTGLGNWTSPQFQPITYPTVSVPIFTYDSKEGILLTDKEGKQHFVPIRDIAQQIGLEW